MQITFNPAVATIQPQKNNNTKKLAENTNKPNYQLMELSNFNSVGRSLVSFKANEQKKTDSDLNNLTVEQLEELKKVYLANQGKIDKKRGPALENLNKIKNWDHDAEYKKQKAEAEAEIINQDLKWYNPSRKKAIRRKHYNEFKAKDDEIQRLKARQAVDEAIIDSTPLSSNQINSLVKQIDDMIKQKKENDKLKARINSIDDVQDAINSLSNVGGGLDDQIAGYDYEKDQINNLFVDPLCKSYDDPNVKVPSGIMLFGATGTGKTSFLRGIAQQSNVKGKAKVVDFSSDTENEDFLQAINNQMKAARARYLELGDDNKPKRTRTILLINEAEKFLSMTPTEAKNLYGEGVFDDMDLETMENYGKSSNEIRKFKTLLDTCSEAPENKDDKTRGAMTIFITTNYPHLIHPDLLSRDGKIKLIAINPAGFSKTDNNIEKVIERYFEKSSNLVEKLKLIENPKDIKSISGLSRKAQDNVKRMLEDGSIQDLSIDYKNYPYDKMAQQFKPSMKKGAFSNDTYRKIAEKSINMYLEDPSHSFGYYYASNLIAEDAPKKLANGVELPSGRDINPQRLKKFTSIFNMLAPAEVDEKEKLLEMEKMGTLDEKAKKRLDYIRIQEQYELENLEEKEKENKLSDDDKKRLNELRNQNNTPQDNTNDEDEEYDG